MFIFGVTGSFGTGKTTVSRMFQSLGAEIIDADKLVHKLMRRDNNVYKKIVSVFGKDILNKKSKQIDRGKLAKIVFDNRSLLKKLCEIIHPPVIAEIKREITKKKNKGCNAVVIDAPLLIEANLALQVDRLIVVKATQTIQIERIKKSLGLSKREILKRINSQIPLRDKIRLADYVIDNSGSFNKTNQQVKDIWSNEDISYGAPRAT